MANVQTVQTDNFRHVIPVNPTADSISSDEKMTGVVATASAVALENLAKQQVSNGSSELQSKVSTLSAEDEVLIAKLKAENVKGEGQKIFEDTLDALVRKMGGFLHYLTVQTKGFNAEKGKLSDPEVNQKWAFALCESKKEASTMTISWAALKEVFFDRIKALRATMEDSEFENAFLKEAIPGVNSYQTNSWTVFSQPRERYYGANHILSELKAALESRAKQIGSQQTDKLAEKKVEDIAAAEIADSVPNPLNKELAELAVEVTALKEVVYVLHAALQNRTSVENALLPKLIYGSYRDSLNLYQEEIANFKVRQEDRIAAIDKDITEGGSSLDEKVRQALVKEKGEISIRWESIVKDEKETVRVLELVKASLKLTDKKMTPSGTTFSSFYISKATGLLNLISSHRSNVVLGAGWESTADLEKKRANHQKDVEKHKRFEEEKAKFEGKDGLFEQHMKIVTTVAKTSQSFIDTLALKMKELDKIAQSIEVEIKGRAKWPEATPPISPAGSPTKDAVK